VFGHRAHAARADRPAVDAANRRLGAEGAGQEGFVGEYASTSEKLRSKTGMPSARQSSITLARVMPFMQ
jgi:hypothetical protein